MALPRLRLHDARHTAMTNWLERGVRIDIAAKWLGDSVTVAMETYSHVLQKGEARALQLVERLP